MALTDQEQAELYGWVKGLAFGDFPKAQAESGEQPIKWWLQAIANQGNAILPIVSDTRGRVRGTEPRGDMLQLIMEKLSAPNTSEVDDAEQSAQIVLANLTDETINTLINRLLAVQAKRLAG